MDMNWELGIDVVRQTFGVKSPHFFIFILTLICLFIGLA